MVLTSLRRIALLLLICVPFSASAQWEAGVELDFLPYATGGWFAAGWAGTGHLRVRALVADVNMPAFVVAEGFKDNHIQSRALTADVFRRTGWQGWWLSAGPVQWKGSIRHESGGPTTEYTSWLLHGGMGYVRFLTDHLYLSPWAGLSLRVAGDDNIKVNARPYDPPLLNPEASLKAGWRF